VGTQPKRHAWNPCYDEHNSQRKHYCDPKVLGVDAPRSGVRDVQLMPPFPAPVDSFRNTTKGLCSVITQYAASDVVVELHPALGSKGVTPSSGKEALSNITIQDAEEGTRAARRGASRAFRRS
jgi:hypothetical protein